MVLENASALYREIKKRGLDLRSDYGRDRELLAKLARELGCADLKLQAYLDGRLELFAEIFLEKFLQIAAPFAKMFEEIWQYLAAHVAPAATETISVRFGLDASRSRSVDLEYFRRYVETAESVIASVRFRTWPPAALGKLFELNRIFASREADPVVSARLGGRPNDYYRPGKQYLMVELPEQAHPLVRQIHQLFQSIIDHYSEAVGEEDRRALPELQNDEASAALRNAASLLTDLLPSWKRTFAAADRLTREEAGAAEEFFAREIEPLLGVGTGQAEVPLLRAMDILDLPFWRDRWHTYEIWASIATLRALTEYQPKLRIANGHIPLDGYATAIIADVTGAAGQAGCVAVQALTSFSGQAIKPDLRICISRDIDAKTTAAIVEFKQRAGMTRGHVEEVATKYAAGAPNAGGVILLNYDEPSIVPNLPARCILLQGVHPLARVRIAEFEQFLLEALAQTGFGPEKRNRVLLLDVSGSMGDSYASPEVQSALRQVLGDRSIKIYRFNDGLVAGGDFHDLNAAYLSGQGGTELGLALTQLEQLIGPVDRMLLVTDGGHENPARLRSIAEVRQCVPGSLCDSVKWLLSP